MMHFVHSVSGQIIYLLLFYFVMNQTLTHNKKYMYAVFDKIMVTDEGRKCVRSYITTFDAQKGLQRLHRRDSQVHEGVFGFGTHIVVHYLREIWRGSMEGNCA